jgi:hypothetical protein
MEFDPSLEVDLVHPPRAWKDPDLTPDEGAFLESMRPLLEEYLRVQGEEPLADVEWQVRG